VPVRTAVIPAAGFGTRFLPATKAVPKELLPIVDRPTIQYIVEECARAGLSDVLLVTAQGKSAIEDHFDVALGLEQALRDKGKDALLAEVQHATELATVHSIRQGEALGLGHAILQARTHVGDDASFVVALGDDVVDPDSDFLERMIEQHEATGRPVVALMDVEASEVDKYGIARTEPTDTDGVVRITGLVEKPDPADAPSTLAVIGRYVLPGSIFPVLADTPPGAGGEIQVTDALHTMAQDEPIIGVRLDDVRHDAGDKLGFLQATVDFASRRDDVGPAFLDWLADFVKERRG
jgi:UTP--glucose-1-phosphate uridylyltransferase